MIGISIQIQNDLVQRKIHGSELLQKLGAITVLLPTGRASAPASFVLRQRKMVVGIMVGMPMLLLAAGATASRSTSLLLHSASLTVPIASRCRKAFSAVQQSLPAQSFLQIGNAVISAARHISCRATPDTGVHEAG